MRLQLFRILEDTLLGTATILTEGHILFFSSCNTGDQRRLGLHSLPLSEILV
jgi:hypothetical protein